MIDIKKLRDNEKENLLLLTKGAAIRFFLTRLFDWYNTPSDANVKKLNPNEYLDKVLFFNKILFIDKIWLTSALSSIIFHMSDFPYYDGKVSILFWLLLAGINSINNLFILLLMPTNI